MLAGKKDPTVELREGVKGEAKSSDLLPYWYSGIDLRRSFVKHPRWHVSDVYLSPILGAACGESALNGQRRIV